MSRAPHVSTDFESQADQDTSGAHPQLPLTTPDQVSDCGESTRLERD